MKFVVLNGSPKGNEMSITMQFFNYFKQLSTDHELIPINVGQLLTNMRIRRHTLEDIISKIQQADGIIWSFPVYTTLIPAQLKKFIELLFENTTDEFTGKHAAVLSTSMKFYDHTAHNYMHAVIEDLGMKYAGFYSATTFDLLDFENRKKWYLFMNSFIEGIESNIPVARRYSKITNNGFKYSPDNLREENKFNNNNKNIVILTDYIDPDSNEAKMVRKFVDCFKYNINVYNLHDINIKGGCLGCLKCGYDNKCIYKDGFCEFFEKNLKNMDVLVYAGRIVDRSLSSQWKLYFDRCFYRGHVPLTEGTQLCFLISGNLSQNDNLRQWLSAIAELGFANLVDIISDESKDSKLIDDLIFNMAKKAISFSESGFFLPGTFLKEGGYKIFRDMLFGLPGALFRKDFKFFKKRKLFDFPTKNIKSRMSRKLISIILKSKKIRKKFQNQINSELAKPIKKKLEKIDYLEENRKILLNRQLWTK